MNVFDLSAKITLDTSEYDNGLSEASKKTSNFSKTMEEIGKSVTSAGKTMSKWVTTPVVGLGTAIIKTGMDYEAGMSKVQAISGATGSEMTMLGEKAMEMAAKTKFSTADSAEAYQYMAMAGWKASDMVDGLAGIMNLAAASGENLGTTSDIVTDALTAFGLKASDSGRFADVLAAASNNANTNVSMLGESFKYVAPVAGALGYSVEDTSIALGLMANSGIKASQAGTSLRTAITNLTKPTSSMAAVMDEYGISLQDADGSMLSLGEIMGVLRERMGGLDQATQASAAATLFGKEAMSGMLAIINAAPEDFDKLTEAINNSAGTTERMASIMQDNAAGAFDRLKSAIDVLFTQLSEILLPIFTKVVEKITEWVNWFGTLDKGTQELILTIAGIAAAVGPVLVIVGNIITAVSTIGNAIGSLIGIISNVGTAVSGLFAMLAANPIALVVAAVAALTAGLIYLWNTNEAFRNAVGEIWEAITGFFTKAVEIIKAAWKGIGEFFSGIWERISSAFDGVVEFFRGIFEGAATAVQAAWEAVVGFFQGIWEGIQSIFSTVAEILGGFFEAAAEAVQSAWTAVVEFFRGVWDGIRSVFETVAEVLGGFFQAAVEAVQSAWGAIVDFFSGIWQGIQGIFSAAADVLGGFFSAAAEAVQKSWNAVVSFFSGVWADIQGVFSSVASVLGGFFSDAWSAIQSVWDKAKSFFSEIAEGIHSAFEEVTSFLGSAFEEAWSLVQSVWETAVSFFQGVWEGISVAFSEAASWFGNIFEQARSAVESAWEGITEFFSGIWEKITGVFSDVWEKFKSIGSNIVNGLKDGIMGAWDAFTGWLGSKVGGIVDAVKGMLGIHSPSKVFAGIGGNMALGLKVGWEDEYSDIKRTIERGMDFGVVDINARANAAYSGSFGNSSQNAEQQITNRGGDTYNFYSTEPLDPVSAAREMKKAKQQMALNYV